MLKLSKNGIDATLLSYKEASYLSTELYLSELREAIYSYISMLKSMGKKTEYIDPVDKENKKTELGQLEDYIGYIEDYMALESFLDKLKDEYEILKKQQEAKSKRKK